MRAAGAMRLALFSWALISLTACGEPRAKGNPELSEDGQTDFKQTEMFKFVCRTTLEPFPYDEAVLLPPSEEWVIWKVLADESLHSICWRRAVLTYGAMGDVQAFRQLNAHLESPHTLASRGRLVSMTHIPEALGMLAGRSRSSEVAVEVVDALRRCSSPQHLESVEGWAVEGVISREAAAKKIALECIYALGLSGHANALQILDELERDPSLDERLLRQIKKARAIFQKVVGGEHRLSPYLQ